MDSLFNSVVLPRIQALGIPLPPQALPPMARSALGPSLDGPRNGLLFSRSIGVGASLPLSPTSGGWNAGLMSAPAPLDSLTSDVHSHLASIASRRKEVEASISNWVPGHVGGGGGNGGGHRDSTIGYPSQSYHQHPYPSYQPSPQHQQHQQQNGSWPPTGPSSSIPAHNHVTVGVNHNYSGQEAGSSHEPSHHRHQQQQQTRVVRDASTISGFGRHPNAQSPANGHGEGGAESGLTPSHSQRDPTPLSMNREGNARQNDAAFSSPQHGGVQPSARSGSKVTHLDLSNFDYEELLTGARGVFSNWRSKTASGGSV